MTPTTKYDTSYETSYYAGARPPNPSNSSLSRAQQHGTVPRSSPRTSSLSLNLKSSLPAMGPKFSSVGAGTALKPSPLSPKDPNLFFDDFSDSFDDDFDRIDDDCYVFGDENMPPRRTDCDVSCTAVFRAGGGDSQQPTVKDTRVVERRAVTVARSPEGWRLPFANRKRIIDEMYEDCGGEINTAPPAKKCSSVHNVQVAAENQTHMRIDGDTWENDWQVEEGVPKAPRRSNDTNQSHGSCDFPNLSHKLERKGHGHESTMDGEPSLARKLALRSGSAKSLSVSAPPSSQQAKKVTTSSSYHRDEEQQLSLVQNMCSVGASESCDGTTESLPKPSQCSFFTAGPTRLVAVVHVTCTHMQA